MHERTHTPADLMLFEKGVMTDISFVFFSLYPRLKGTGRFQSSSKLKVVLIFTNLMEHRCFDAGNCPMWNGAHPPLNNQQEKNKTKKSLGPAGSLPRLSPQRGLLVSHHPVTLQALPSSPPSLRSPFLTALWGLTCGAFDPLPPVSRMLLCLPQFLCALGTVLGIWGDIPVLGWGPLLPRGSKGLFVSSHKPGKRQTLPDSQGQHHTNTDKIRATEACWLCEPDLIWPLGTPPPTTRGISIRSQMQSRPPQRPPGMGEGRSGGHSCRHRTRLPFPPTEAPHLGSGRAVPFISPHSPATLLPSPCLLMPGSSLRMFWL
jgi:hypothetical protein